MSTVIRVENLGKCYTIKHQSQARSGEGLRHALQDAFSAPFRRSASSGPGSENEEFWALKEVSFEVRDGEVVGIIGRNGAGKSTLLKVLSRITEPTIGRVGLKGRVASLLEVGTGFHPELTGRENIFLNGAILGMSRAEVKSKFDEIVDFSGVEKFLDTPVKHYSSGMYVRLAFAVAAHLEPEILIIDEVLAVGDAEFQKKCLGKMRDVATGGRTVLFVSHNLGAVQALCGRAVLLKEGQIIGDGLPSEVMRGYILSGDGVQTQSRKSVRPGIKQIESLSTAQKSYPPRRPLEFRVVVSPPVIAEAFHLSLTISTLGGEELFLVSTEHLNERQRGHGSMLQFTIRQPWLAPGEYSVSVLIYADGIGTIDRWDHAIGFVIEDFGEESYYGFQSSKGCRTLLSDFTVTASDFNEVMGASL